MNNLTVQTMNNILILHIPGILKPRTVKLKYVIHDQGSQRKDMQLNKPAMLIQHKVSKKQEQVLQDDKNCQATMSHKKQKKCEFKDSKRQSAVKYVCSDKNCQESIRPKKPRSHMWSVTNNADVWLPKPTVPYEYSRLCKDKN